MSAFLGKIHYWLYDKIMLHEKLIESVIALAEKNGVTTIDLINESYSRYGSPIKGALENEINHSNIHGWLQQQISSVEIRMAYIVTELIKSNAVSKEDIEKVFYTSAADTASCNEINAASPQDMYKLIFDYVLEGMPCDNVNLVTENTETVISWKITSDLHEDFWKEVGGDPQNHHQFRDSWIKGFISTGGTSLRFIRIDSSTSTIERI